jgi:hypothetical protein
MEVNQEQKLEPGKERKKPNVKIVALVLFSVLFIAIGLVIFGLKRGGEPKETEVYLQGQVANLLENGGFEDN